MKETREMTTKHETKVHQERREPNRRLWMACTILSVLALVNSVAIGFDLQSVDIRPSTRRVQPHPGETLVIRNDQPSKISVSTTSTVSVPDKPQKEDDPHSVDKSLSKRDTSPNPVKEDDPHPVDKSLSKKRHLAQSSHCRWTPEDRNNKRCSLF